MASKYPAYRIAAVLFMIAFLLGLTFSIFHVTPVKAARFRFVQPDGTGDCSDWANACELQTALTGAVSGDEIWVAAGTYRPTSGTSRNATFQLVAGVTVYGGFAGTETGRDERNPVIHITILSGDLNNDDVGFTNNSENVYHVVTGANEATLDGVTITAGNANGNPYSPNESGGGMNNISCSPTLSNIIFKGNWAMYGGGINNQSSSPTLTDVIFTGNSSGGNGGGMYSIASSSPILERVTFSGNIAAFSGGGMGNKESSSPILTDVTFNGNSANSGGGMFNNSSSPTLSRVTFSANAANYSSDGGYGTAFGGGMHNQNSSSPTLTNVTFSGNTASYGGGMNNDSNCPGCSGTSSPTLTNATFTNNTAIVHGSGMYNIYGNPHIRSTIFWGNIQNDTGEQVFNAYASGSVLSSSVVQGGCPAASTCTTLLDVDPRLGPLGSYGGFAQTIPLLPGSSAKDSGDDGVCPATDQRGISRPQGAHCDIGAYEDDGTVIHYILFAAPGAVGDCSSWANACALQTALNSAIGGNEIWAVAGTYKPTTGTERSATFQLKNNVAVYGGFAGIESLRSQRNPAAHLTLLSGDLNGDDIGFTNNAENSLHVVTGVTGATAIMDGFTITAGNANGAYPNDCGGGMYNDSYSSPMLANITFSGNAAETFGGGMCNRSSSSPRLVNVSFSGNTTAGSGGGIYNWNNSNPQLLNASFSANSAANGGGMASEVNSSPILVAVTFSANTAANGGGMFNSSSAPVLRSVFFGDNSGGYGGGIYNNNSSPTLTNVTFSHNTATKGGGMYGEAISIPTLTNVTFSRNEAVYGGGMYNKTDFPPNFKSTITNSIFWGNLASTAGAQIFNEAYVPLIWNSIIQNGCPAATACFELITTDPLLGVLGSYGGETQVYPLLPGSAAIDAGKDSTCAAEDQRGIARPQGAHCDIGAYESQGFTLAIKGGDNQSAQQNANFSDPLSVTVTPVNVLEPVDGGQVTFTAPANGASAVIIGSSAIISNGSAGVTAKANNTLGAYTVIASATGASPVSFSLENVNKIYGLYLPVILR